MIYITILKHLNVSNLRESGSYDLVFPEHLLVLRKSDALDQPLGGLVDSPVVHLALPPDVPKVLDCDLGVLGSSKRRC